MNWREVVGNDGVILQSNITAFAWEGLRETTKMLISGPNKIQSLTT
jgi:hypothetical protein